MQPKIHVEMTVLEVVERWPATRAVFQRCGIPTQATNCPAWETVEQAAAAHGHRAADRLLAELKEAAGPGAGIQADTPVIQTVTIHPATQSVFERYDIPCQVDRVTVWETIEQAAAARGHWAADALLDELNAVCSNPSLVGQPPPDTLSDPQA
jgi:hypothetical protein